MAGQFGALAGMNAPDAMNAMPAMSDEDATQRLARMLMPPQDEVLGTASRLRTQLRAPLPGQEGAMPMSTADALRAGDLPPIINAPGMDTILPERSTPRSFGDMLSSIWGR